jgi:predicted PurR-regulated permease PerM
VRSIGWDLVIFFVLLLFLLAARQPWRERLASLFAASPQSAAHLKEITGVIETDVSQYLLTISLINAALGICIGLGLYLLGFPDAVLWGVMAGCLNYVPYLGVAVGASVVGLVGLVSLDGTGALAALGIYLGFNLIEAQLITPTVLGRRFALNPTIVFLCILFWGWLWGIPGVLMAVPFLLILRAACDGLERLSPVARFIAGHTEASAIAEEVQAIAAEAAK